MHFRCPTAKIVGTSVINDYELLFKGSLTGAYLTIEKKKSSKVPVAVWEVTAEDERSLNRYEGCPRFYYKKDMTLNINGVGKTDCFVYIMHENRKLRIPSNAYVEAVLDGYVTFQFDKKYLTKAVQKSKEAVSNERKYKFRYI
ncbi:MAG: gamma-glutamylcyclotransferase [Clostridiales bacterium]|nr:gamma-glutamylcyclotransferase [Clostridiales bacterium]